MRSNELIIMERRELLDQNVCPDCEIGRLTTLSSIAESTSIFAGKTIHHDELELTICNEPSCRQVVVLTEDFTANEADPQVKLIHINY